MIQLLPLKRRQITVALLGESTVMLGHSASSPAAETSTGSDQSPPAGRPALWMIQLLPSKRSQTAVALPCWSTATLMLNALLPAAETSTGSDQSAPAGRSALWTINGPASYRSQTAVALRCGSTAT